MENYNKVLLALDFSEHTEMLCNKAVSIAEKHSAELVLIHVIEPIIIDSGYDFLPVSDIDLEEGMVENANKQLQEIAQQHGIAKQNIRLQRGSTKQEILSVAKHEGFDLIIVGSHGRHGVALLLGSTANAVLHGAPCDVLAVRIHEHD